MGWTRNVPETVYFLVLEFEKQRTTGCNLFVDSWGWATVNLACGCILER
jgi:hypothetical protein